MHSLSYESVAGIVANRISWSINCSSRTSESAVGLVFLTPMVFMNPSVDPMMMAARAAASDVISPGFARLTSIAIRSSWFA